MGIEAAHRAAVRTETLVSIAINALVPTLVIWLLGVSPPASLLGQGGILPSMLPAAGIATFVMTLLLTQIVRARVRRGSLPALNWPRAERGMMRFIPQNYPLRALALGLLAVVLLVPTGVLIFALFDRALHLLPLTRSGFVAFNITYGAIVGAVMARFVVLPALADPVRRVEAGRSASSVP